MVKLTAMEIKLVNAMRENEYNDALKEGYTWTFAAIDNSGIAKSKVSGVISSLVQKGLVIADKGEEGESDVIGFTEKGKKLFDKADGKDCGWGGKKLLKEVEEKGEVKKVSTKKEEEKKMAKKEEKTVTVVAFTGMEIGTFKVVKETTKSITVKTASGVELVFDKETGVQTNYKQARFANKIVK